MPIETIRNNKLRENQPKVYSCFEDFLDRNEWIAHKEFTPCRRCWNWNNTKCWEEDGKGFCKVKCLKTLPNNGCNKDSHWRMQDWLSSYDIDRY